MAIVCGAQDRKPEASELHALWIIRFDTAGLFDGACGRIFEFKLMHGEEL